MKILHTLTLFLLTIASSLAQQVFVDPTEVTLTKPGTVTVIVSGELIGYNAWSHTDATVGTVKASLVHRTYDSTSTSNLAWLTASSAESGTLDAGTYPVVVVSDPAAMYPGTVLPYQITVILWNESATSSSGTNALSELTLSYDSATDADKAAFQALIVSLVQQQLDTLQARIDTQQSQIDSILSQLADLQNSNDAQHADLQNQIDTLQGTVESQQNTIVALQQSLSTTQDQYSQLTNTLTSLTSRVDSGSSTGGGSSKPDDTLSKIGIGLGAAGVIGSVVNFFIGDGNTDNSAAVTDAPFNP